MTVVFLMFRDFYIFTIFDFILSTFLQVGSEESVFEALLAWIKYSPGSREEHLPRLLQYVRLPLLSAKYITDVLDSEVTCCIILLLSLLCYYKHRRLSSFILLYIKLLF